MPQIHQRLPLLVSLNPLHVFLWTFRREGRDVVNLYNSLSPVMQLATGGGDMLNFGYWKGAAEPLAAQQALCSLVGDIAELGSAKTVIDVGSGLAAPARLWKSVYDIQISCANINYGQLRASKKKKPVGASLVNATSTCLPYAVRSADRIIALESAQHFRPLEDFAMESKRILKDGGLLIVTIPVVTARHPALKLGILSATWSSEHYSLSRVKSALQDAGFAMAAVRMIGRQVYDPLANYYVANRSEIRRKILTQYPSFLETVLYLSILKMKQVSEKGVIDYAVIKAAA
jgi:cyclopropane fatty-acyl-phospholipid synthase-like methyltransferase